MKRRKLIQYGALSSTSFFLNTGFLNHPQKDALSFASISTKCLYDWIILYWMPDDNNLSRFGIPILQMLSRGVQSENILVVV